MSRNEIIKVHVTIPILVQNICKRPLDYILTFMLHLQPNQKWNVTFSDD